MIWDIALRKQLRHGASHFELDVRFASSAQRVVLFRGAGDAAGTGAGAGVAVTALIKASDVVVAVVD